MCIDNFNLSKYNDSCLEVINKSIAVKYHLVSGVSSYEIDKEFLFKEELKPLMLKFKNASMNISGPMRS
jgi:hypothetical protein